MIDRFTVRASRQALVRMSSSLKSSTSCRSALGLGCGMVVGRFYDWRPIPKLPNFKRVFHQRPHAEGTLVDCDERFGR